MSAHPGAAIEPLILTIRNTRIILSPDLATIYGVATKVLNQAVKRNRDRFPEDFAFRLTRKETVRLERSRSQFVTLKRGENLKYTPLAFTEHGAVMAATVLNSPRAVQMSIWVVRAFLHMRSWVADQTELAERLNRLEQKVGTHDKDLKVIIQAIRQLLDPGTPSRKRIGFHPEAP